MTTATKKWAAGTAVKFSHPVDAAEAKIRFIVIEDWRDQSPAAVKVEMTHDDLGNPWPYLIKPVSVMPPNELEQASA